MARNRSEKVPPVIIGVSDYILEPIRMDVRNDVPLENMNAPADILYRDWPRPTQEAYDAISRDEKKAYYEDYKAWLALNPCRVPL